MPDEGAAAQPARGRRSQRHARIAVIIGGRHVRIGLWWDDYPTRQRHEGVPDGAGTFGAPNVGTQDMGLPGVERQMIRGNTPDDFSAESARPKPASPTTHRGRRYHTRSRVTRGSTPESKPRSCSGSQTSSDAFFTRPWSTGGESHVRDHQHALRPRHAGRSYRTSKSGTGVMPPPVRFSGSGVIADPGAPFTGGPVSEVRLVG